MLNVLCKYFTTATLRFQCLLVATQELTGTEGTNIIISVSCVVAIGQLNPIQGTNTIVRV